MEVRKNVIVPNESNYIELFDDNTLTKGDIMQISVSIILSNQSVEKHKHYDMNEIFIVEEGELDITVDDNIVHMCKGDAVLVRPGHYHGLFNSSPETCKVLIIAIACPL